MKLKFFNLQTVERNIKATVHRTGKLGFTVEAAKKMSLSVGKSFKIATNEDDDNDTNLYGVLYNTVEPNSFKLYKAGNYHFINLKPLFDSIKLNYETDTYIYDLVEEEIDGTAMIVFKRRKIEKKLKKG